MALKTDHRTGSLRLLVSVFGIYFTLFQHIRSYLVVRDTIAPCVKLSILLRLYRKCPGMSDGPRQTFSQN